MISPPCRDSGRRGLTVLEALVALGIFLIALIGIGRLITLGADQALAVHEQGRAAQLCQAKLAEVVAGAVPLSGQTDVPFDEDSSWVWSLDAGQADIAGLWKITVRVARQRSDGSQIECSLDRMLLDPSVRGSALDAATIAANSSSNPNTSNTSSTSGSSGTGSGASSGSSANKAPSGSGASGPSSPSGAGSSSGAGTPKSSSGSTPAPSSSGKGTTKGGS